MTHTTTDTTVTASVPTMKMTPDPASPVALSPQPPAVDTTVDSMAAARAAVLSAAFASLSRAGVPYCVTHNHDGLPATVGTDVDAVTTAAALASLAPSALTGPGHTLVQWLAHRACWAVLAGPGPGGVPSLVQLHLSPAFEPDDVPCYLAEEILADREQPNGFWATPAAAEFGCVLANRVTKESLRAKHTDRLAALFAVDPVGCERRVRRFFTGANAEAVLAAARTDRWADVEPMLPVLGQELRRRGHAGGGIVGGLAKWGRRAGRWARPSSGLHVVFLGPDGVGKSTVIEAVKTSLSPAFLRYSYQTFAPALLPGKLQPKKDTPHQLPPRGKAASWVKAAWWSVCYTAGYQAAIRPTVARGGLVVNHRYLPDAIVDPKRYRYSGPRWILSALWKVAPKPDLLFVLDAPADVIQRRKTEVTPAETARQREGYRAVAAALPNAHIVSTDRPLAAVVAEVNGLCLAYMAARVAKRFKPSEGKSR